MCICEAWLLLAAAVYLRMIPPAESSLAPLQFGDGIQGSADNIGQTINADLC
jgi:hypothetical protein